VFRFWDVYSLANCHDIHHRISYYVHVAMCLVANKKYLGAIGAAFQTELHL